MSRVALLSPRFVSGAVLDFVSAFQQRYAGLQTVIGFEVPGPMRNRLATLTRRWRLVPMTPRERALRKYADEDQPGSEASHHDVLAFAASKGLSCFNPEAMNHPSTAAAVQASTCSVIVCLGSGIVRDILLGLPGVTFLNAHPGKLPELPGRDTPAWAVYLNEPVYGSVHRMATRVDVGDTLLVRPIEIGRPRTVRELHQAAWASTWNLVIDAMHGLDSGQLAFTPQDLTRRRHMCYRMHPELLRVVARRLRDDSYFKRHEQCLEDADRSVRPMLLRSAQNAVSH
jgi:folate-dependent phosphoribosylglycinamide formyltransferase PurN